MALKYKVGDRVRIKSINWYNENKDKYDSIYVGNGFYFWKNMARLCGEIMKIAVVKVDPEDSNKGYYFMENSEERWTDEMIEGLVEEEGKEGKSKDIGEMSDGYHIFNELYEYRMLYNAALFNEFAKQGLYDVHKSRKHSDGEYPFGDSNWFIVMAELPTGQISNHYEMKDWDKFQIPEKPLANKWDEHSLRDVAERLTSFTTPKKEYPKTYLECAIILDCLSTIYIDGYKSALFEKLQELFICRDAYWKIAGEEMGLGKPWKPDWNTPNNTYYTIIVKGNEIYKSQAHKFNEIFAFPTEEMRDAFKENFDKDLEFCKELL